MRLKAGELKDKIGDTAEFQFQIGAIKSLDKPGEIDYYIRFNSRLVRLKVVLLKRVLVRYLCFNSRLVRLKALRISTIQSKTYVSIPDWCD